MLRKDTELIPILLTTSMANLIKIYEKKKFKKLAEFIFALMGSDQ